MPGGELRQVEGGEEVRHRQPRRRRRRRASAPRAAGSRDRPSRRPALSHRGHARRLADSRCASALRDDRGVDADRGEDHEAVDPLQPERIDPHEHQPVADDEQRQAAEHDPESPCPRRRGSPRRRPPPRRSPSARSRRRRGRRSWRSARPRARRRSRRAGPRCRRRASRSRRDGMPISAAPAGLEPMAKSRGRSRCGGAAQPATPRMTAAMTTTSGTPATCSAGHVEPGLRHLVGADLPAAGPEAVEAAEDRHGAEGDDDRRHLPEGDDAPVDQPAGEPDGAAGGEAGGDAERRGRGSCVSAEP